MTDNEIREIATMKSEVSSTHSKVTKISLQLDDLIPQVASNSTSVRFMKKVFLVILSGWVIIQIPQFVSRAYEMARNGF